MWSDLGALVAMQSCDPKHWLLCSDVDIGCYAVM